ncbi:MAG: hypothetical protein IAE79_17085 [Anaerolinea sp.]|nr:hypothetical protein [Anaerolinea sp.]
MSGNSIRKLLFIFILGGFFWTVQCQATTGAGDVQATINAEESDTRVWLELPATAVSGQPLLARLMAEGVPSVGGFEVRLQYDPAAIMLLNAKASTGWAGERALLHVGDVPQPDGVLLGSASCPVADCASANYTNEPRHEPAANSSPIELAAFELEVRGSDALPIISDILLLDTAGKVLLAGGQYEADAAASLEPAIEALDLSGNGVVNDADAYLVVSLWRELRRDGRCLETAVIAYDVNGSGCLTMADVQTILAAWGQGAGVSPPTPTEMEAPEATFVVNSSGDRGDINPGDGQCWTINGRCTLRAAIQEANARPGTDNIHFNIRSPDGSCPDLITIQPAGGLIIDAPDNAGVTIDGYTQCNAQANSQWVNGNAVIKIEIMGNSEVSVYGLHILSPNNVVKGVAVYNWHRQIQLLGARAHDNSIEGNFLGTNAENSFTHSAPFEGEGLRLGLGANNNVIGGATQAARNIVSGNDQDGVGLQGDGVEHNVVINNYIGLRQNGTSRLRNGADGVDVAEGVANNRIGGLNPGERNIISGNNRDGIEISHNLGTTGNHIVGNFIGLRPSGNQSLYNGSRGITLEDQVTGNLIYRNVIVGNGGDGVRFYTVFDNQLYDNFIGVRPTGVGPRDVVPVPGTEEGLEAMPNGAIPDNGYGLSGVYMTGGSQGNSVTHNFIAYHPEYGILLDSNKGYLGYGTCETKHNSFSRNSLFDNEMRGIRLRSGVCDDNEEHFPNEGIDAPQITTATTVQVTGETCNGCLVQLFLTDKTVLNDPNGDNWGEGQQYLAQGSANGSGHFAIYVTAVSAGDILTAHATDDNGNTSEFARNVQAVYEPPVYRIYLSVIGKDS